MTEAGPAFQGTVKSAVAFGALLAEGIGDTIRVSLSAPPVEEVKVGIAILESLGLRQRGLEIVSCPSCGRAQVDVYTLADEVTAALDGLDVPLRVAVMGCVVNGPGEAREADLGVASGNGKGQIFVRGEVIKTVPESQIVETLIEEAMKLAAAMTAGAERRLTPAVTGRSMSGSWRPRRRGRGARLGLAAAAAAVAGLHRRVGRLGALARSSARWSPAFSNSRGRQRARRRDLGCQCAALGFVPVQRASAGAPRRRASCAAPRSGSR